MGRPTIERDVIRAKLIGPPQACDPSVQITTEGKVVRNYEHTWDANAELDAAVLRVNTLFGLSITTGLYGLKELVTGSVKRQLGREVRGLGFIAFSGLLAIEAIHQLAQERDARERVDIIGEALQSPSGNALRVNSFLETG